MISTIVTEISFSTAHLRSKNNVLRNVLRPTLMRAFKFLFRDHVEGPSFCSCTIAVLFVRAHCYNTEKQKDAFKFAAKFLILNAPVRVGLSAIVFDRKCAVK